MTGSMAKKRHSGTGRLNLKKSLMIMNKYEHDVGCTNLFINYHYELFSVAYFQFKALDIP